MRDISPNEEQMEMVTEQLGCDHYAATIVIWTFQKLTGGDINVATSKSLDP